VNEVWQGLQVAFGQAQQWLFESLVQPLVFALGLGGWLEVAFDGTGWLLVGLIQLAVMLAIIAPLQRLWPAEPLRDRAAVRTDIIYTLIHRLGVFRVAMFFALEPLLDSAFGALRAMGVPRLQVDGLWPGVTDLAWVSFLVYLLLFDFVDYWMHRAQHRWAWWWQLHALHHSQQQMTMWTDNRNHLLDDVIRSVVLAVVAQAVGVPPAQFVLLVAITQLSENFQHANLRWSFGRIGERLWVSPRFHRVHHSIHTGERNYGVLLPWWDMLFGTANFDARYDATGVRDAVEQGRDYGRGFWSQQWRGLLRLAGRA
jgi:sterol desaturase/sphingolipid hydroxylase (fatty acid hydroxylase superfamily)